ncbi:hypothetical protein N8527_00840 [bacterium]|nr:hypothetical protein [bacterium]
MQLLLCLLDASQKINQIAGVKTAFIVTTIPCEGFLDMRVRR